MTTTPKEYRVFAHIVKKYTFLATVSQGVNSSIIKCLATVKGYDMSAERQFDMTKAHNSTEWEINNMLSGCFESLRLRVENIIAGEKHFNEAIEKLNESDRYQFKLEEGSYPEHYNFKTDEKSS